MKKLIVKVKRENIEVIKELEKFGNIEVVSLLMNIFSIETKESNLYKIEKIPGVLKVEYDDVGYLKLATT